ncbi:hypothetical protein FC756_24035 [Lysinibacillus mangiferihumi]|uniref:Uncharacterized protein n=1 Tax=Lysinibacillus mangiferihumi TaxID=1130819 RepID=A0A4U2XZJ5_9BACI|nr:hypothetical protein [Lysinibacillus mangiferihumi]TKI53417.1 hypothetical protein FC756_24035 [Lysinibacillus mangiferihumi]
MKIKKIHWISQESLEAEVVVTDGEFEIICFAQPLNYLEESNLIESIYCFNVSDLVKAEKSEYSIEKLDNYFAYRLIGKLIDKQNEQVKLGELLLELENNLLPGDINEGDFVSFCCQRLDIY